VRARSHSPRRYHNTGGPRLTRLSFASDIEESPPAVITSGAIGRRHRTVHPRRPRPFAARRPIGEDRTRTRLGGRRASVAQETQPEVGARVVATYEPNSGFRLPSAADTLTLDVSSIERRRPRSPEWGERATGSVPVTTYAGRLTSDQRGRRPVHRS